MKSKIKILLISNYRLDNQISMLKFSEMLYSDYNRKFELEEIYPKSFVSIFFKEGNLRKWASYVDKYLIFKNKIRNHLNIKHKLIHITDHSNAIYTSVIKNKLNTTVLVTCHDLIAIRQAKNEFKQAPKTRTTGKLLQTWIFKSLKEVDYYACDSMQTLGDLNRLIPNSSTRSKIIHLGSDFPRKNDHFIEGTDKIFDAKKENFILHVGSSAWYKNRKAVFDSFRVVKQKFKDMKLVLVGPKPQKSELDDKLGLWFQNNSRDIIIFDNISYDELKYLYSNAELLLFPSLIEGFGWPPIEAVHYNCLIISVKTGAIYDLLGNNAHYVDPNSQQNINLKVLEILSSKKLIKPTKDLPTIEHCRKNYYKLYERLISKG